jgi:hypothetical protein
LAFLLILVFVALVMLPQTDMAKTFLLEQTKQLIGQDIRVQKIDLALLPSPRLQLVDVEIKNINAHLEYFNAQFLEIEILLLPLFLRTIVVERFILEQPEVTVRLLDKKTILSAPTPESQTTLSKGPSFAFKQIAIRQGKLNLRKESRFKGTKDLQIEDILITLSAQSSFSQATVRASAKTSNPKTGDSILVVSGSITQQPFRNMIPVQPRDNSFSLQFTGHAELSNFDIVLVKEFFELGAELEGLQVMTNLKSRLTLFPDKSGLTLVYSELEGTFGNIPIRGKGSFSGLLGDTTTFFASFTSSPKSLRAFESVLPVTLVPSDVRKTIEKLEIDGKVEVINSILAGSTADDIRTSIVQEVRISQGRLLLNRNTPPITNIEGTVVWDNGELRLHNFSGKYRSTNILDGQGEIQFRKSGPWAKFQAASHVDIQDLLTTWKAFASPLAIPPMLEDLQGTGNVTMKVQGPLLTPENMVFPAINLRDWNLLTSQDLPPIHHVSGTVRLMKNRLTLTDFKAQYGSSKLLNGGGTVLFRKKEPWAHFKADTVISIQNIKSMAAQLGLAIEMPSALESLEGEGNLSVELKGPLNDLQKIEIEKAWLTEGRFQIHPDLPVIQQVVVRASYKDGILRLTDFNTEFGASQIRETSATVNFRGIEPTINMEIHAKVMAKDVVDIIKHIDPIPETLQPVRELEEVTGGARLKAKLHGPLKHPEQLRVLSGEIYVENIGFRAPQVSEPIEQINGRILISNDMMSISDFSGRMRESRASLGGILDWRKGTLFKDLLFQANVKSADIKKIRPGILPDALQGTFQLNGIVFGQHDSPRYRIQANLKEIDLNIPDVIHKPRGMPASFKVHGKLQHQKVIILDYAEFHLPSVSLSGQGTFDTRAPFTISASLESTPISLASIPEEILFGVKKFQSGDLILALEVEGRGTDWRGWQMNGSAQLNNVITGDDAPDDPITTLSVDVSLTQDQDELRFLMEAIPIKNILPLLGITEYPLEGEVYGNGLLQGRLEPDQDLIPTLSGNMTLLINEGIVHGGAVLPKILSFMNFPSLISGEVQFDQENIPFDSISTDIDVAKGIFHTENFILKSPIVMLSAVGKYDLPADQMDFVVAASPLGPYRNVVEDIPLVNRLIGENFLAVFYEVKGPPQNPDIQPMPLESMEAGTKQLFQQSMEALKDAVPLPEEE